MIKLGKSILIFGINSEINSKAEWLNQSQILHHGEYLNIAI